MNSEINYVSPFKKFCISIGNLPTAYLESMSYYESLTYLVNYLSNNVIPALNNNGEVVEELQQKFTELQNFVDTYFDNLDVQEEVNNKLDEMAESGELTDIIAQYLGLAGMLVYNTLSDMKSAENIVNGSTCQTLGYHSINDNGKAKYKVRSITNEDVIDDSTIVSLHNINLVAELIQDDTITPEQIGCYGNGTNDDSSKFQILLNLEKNIKLKDNATYLITSNLDLPNYVNIDGNNALIKVNYNGNREHIIKNSNWESEGYTNTLILNNINFYLNSTLQQSKLIGLSNYNKIEIQNCNYSNNEDISYGSWFIDMYSNNKNVLIDKINVTTLSNTLAALNTCIGIREHSSSGVTNNITINNSTFIHNASDETIWIDGWYGELSDVTLFNNKFYDKSTNDTTFCWIGLGIEGEGTIRENALVKNIIIDNCYFEKDEIDYASLKLGYCNSSYVGTNKVQNFTVSNTHIVTKTGNGSAIHTYGNSVLFNNITVEHLGTLNYSYYGYICDGSAEFKNSTFIISAETTNTSIAFTGDNIKLIDCNIKVDDGHLFNGGTRYLNNCIVDGVKTLLYISANATVNFTLENSNVKAYGHLFMRFNASNDQTIKINGCNIQCDTIVFDDWNLTGTKNIELTNTNFDNTTLQICNRVDDVIAISNCSHKGKTISGIPVTEGERGSFVIGTVFDGGAGHSVARKISDGYAASNWELI